jgi:hypothetical protein
MHCTATAAVRGVQLYTRDRCGTSAAEHKVAIVLQMAIRL